MSARVLEDVRDAWYDHVLICFDSVLISRIHCEPIWPIFLFDRNYIIAIEHHLGLLGLTPCFNQVFKCFLNFSWIVLAIIICSGRVYTLELNSNLVSFFEQRDLIRVREKTIFSLIIFSSVRIDQGGDLGWPLLTYEFDRFIHCLIYSIENEIVNKENFYKVAMYGFEVDLTRLFSKGETVSAFEHSVSGRLLTLACPVARRRLIFFSKRMLGVVFFLLAVSC